MDNWKHLVFNPNNKPYAISILAILFILPVAPILDNRVQNIRSSAATTHHPRPTTKSLSFLSITETARLFHISLIK